MRPHGQFGLLLILVFLLLSASNSVFGQVYLEDFFDEADNATSGTAIGGTWTTTLPTGGASSFSRFDFGAPYQEVFRVNDTGTEGVWRSNVIDISALGEVALEIMLGGNATTAADYVRAYYRIDGGVEIMFGEVIGSAGLNVFTASSAVVSGGTLELVIRAMDNSSGGIANTMGFDDVRVTDISVLYSRASSAWSVGTTWSTGGFAGVSCGCTPDADSRVVIGNGRTVSVNADGTAAGIEIQSTGILQYTANNVDLTVERGGSVEVLSGGTLTRVATSSSTIQFMGYTYSMNVAGTLSMGTLVFNGSANSTFTNSGTVTLETGLVVNGGDGYTFNNSGTLTLATINPNSGDITVNNTGTINQTGNFLNVDTGSSFNNLANGTWNFAGTGIANVRLFANNNSNTFNYNGAVQTIITPQDAYSNLTLSGSGAKTAGASFSVNGNWTRSGTATYATGGFRVTLNGSISQTIIATGGETFANLTIDNSSATSPQITLSNSITVSTNLTMLDGNINLNGNSFTLSSNAATALTHTQLPGAGWMYGGSLVRSFPNGAVAIGNVAGYFPLGSDSNSRPFFLGKTSSGGSSSGAMTISYNDANTVTTVSFLDGATPIQSRHDGFWSVTKTGMTAGTYEINAGGTGFTIGAISETRLTRQSDATGIGTALGSGGTASDVRVRRNAVPAAGLANNFYMASTNSSNTPLPILLSYFHARIQGDEVTTTWKTTQEKNNHYFTVEKTTDFETFVEAGRIDGQGNSDDEYTYSFIDDSPFIGRSYYRLKQTDFDGAFTVSGPVMINYDGPLSPLLKTYPNPFDGKSITLEIKGVTGVPSITIHLYNQHGQKVMEISFDEDGPGVFKKEILFPDNLSPGLYFLKAGRTLQLTSKVVVY